MRRYFFSKLNIKQLIIKIILSTILLVCIYLILGIFIKYGVSITFKYYIIPLGILVLVVTYNVGKNSGRKSFYFNNNKIIFCNNNNERSFLFSSINSIEVLYDLDSIFGYRKLILSRNDSKRKYRIMLDKVNAEKLSFWIQAKLEDDQVVLVDDLKEFLED